MEAPLSRWSLLLLLVLAGCGSGKPLPGPPAQPVKGQVTYQGGPAAGFRVILVPVKPWKGAQFAPSGITDAEGKFQLGSYKPDDGAPAGEYVATFTWPRHLNTPDDDSGSPEVDQLEGRYADPKTSPFRVSVQEGPNELPPFPLN